MPSSSGVISIRSLPKAGPFPTMDPFLFVVYHKDHYPPAINERMEAPRRGDGHDFDPSAPYRMYHGDKIPGFPQHPHRGFETITATIEGLIDHADSVGNAGRYGEGDLQWMTAGKGVVHSEMFPLLSTKKDNPLRFFQIWLNLPAASKMVDPSFAMFWSKDIPVYETEHARVTVWAGSYFGVDFERQNSPPPASWASDESNDVAILHITVRSGGSVVIPKANRQGTNRCLFLIEGAGGVKVSEEELNEKVVCFLDEMQDIVVEVHSSNDAAEFLLLQGQPIDEPVAQYGPFVMNSEDEIQQAFRDYRQTEFGGWPWKRDDMVFEAEKGRFAILNGNETNPEICEAER